MPEYTEKIWPRTWQVPIAGAIIATAATACALVLVPRFRDHGMDPIPFLNVTLIVFGIIILTICLTEAFPYMICVRDATLYLTRGFSESTYPVARIDAIEEAGVDPAQCGLPTVRLWVGGRELDRLVPTLHPQALAQALGKPLVAYAAPGSVESPQAVVCAPYEELHRGSAVGARVWLIIIVACWGFIVQTQVQEHHLWAAAGAGLYLLLFIWRISIPDLYSHLLRIRVADGVLTIMRGRRTLRKIPVESIEWIVSDEIRSARWSLYSILWRGPILFAVNPGSAIQIGARGYTRRMIIRTDDPNALARALGHELLTSVPVPQVPAANPTT